MCLKSAVSWRRRAVAFCVIAQTFLISGTLVARAPFDFSHYATLREGTRFKIQNGGEWIGKGQIVSISRNDIRMVFEIHKSSVSVRGDVSLSHLRTEKQFEVLDLKYSGNVNGAQENSSEQVKSDLFLCENGILAFRFLKGSRFFQLSVNRAGESAVTTDWGTGKLLPER